MAALQVDANGIPAGYLRRPMSNKAIIKAPKMMNAVCTNSQGCLKRFCLYELLAQTGKWKGLEYNEHIIIPKGLYPLTVSVLFPSSVPSLK